MRIHHFILICQLFIMAIPLNTSGQDSIKLNDLLFLNITFKKPLPQCFDTPHIIRNKEDFQTQNIASCFNFSHDLELEKFDLIIWEVNHVRSYRTKSAIVQHNITL